MIGSTSSGVCPGRSRLSTVSSHRSRDHVPALGGRDHRRRERERKQRLDRLGGERVERAQPLQHLIGRRPLAEHDIEEACDLRPDRGLGPIGGQLLDQRRRLHERVVGDPRHRGVAAAAVHGDPEGRAHLLRGGAEIEDAAAELDPLAAALVDRVVDPDGVGMVLAEPLEAVVVADLLVGRGDEDEIARRREALAGERGDRDGARRDLVLHVERAAPPDVVVGEVAGPRVARPLGRDRRRRCRCARGSRARARRRP